MIHFALLYRSKLKCDRRGCQGICPDGTLAATKGNKVLMAQAQRLSEQVKSLNSRVRELEAALAQTQSTKETIDTQTSPEPHDEGLQAMSEAIGSLSLGIDGQAKYHGESAGSEYLQDLLPREEAQPSRRAPIDLPDEILTLMHAFPFGFKDCPYNKSIFIRYLPSKQRAVELACIYYDSVAWMYDPISSEDFSASILAPIYGSDGYPSTDALHSHRLAVFFMILANGNLYDSHPSAVAVAEQYHALARAALSLDSVLVEVTCATVQALFLVFRFSYNASKAEKEERWLLTGLATRVAQTIGLQRDSAAWNLEPDEVQRRRRVALLGTVHLGELTFLQKLYKRASASYTAFITGQSLSVTSGSADDLDELEVLGGRKSVITTRSNPNSPSLVTPGSPSTLHQDTVGGSSPVSQPSVAEMSIEYYQPMDPGNVMQKSQDFQMDDNRLRFAEHTYPSIGKAIHHPMSTEQAPVRATPTTYMTNHHPMPMSDVQSAHPLREQAVLQQGSKVANTWHPHASYALPQHPYSQQPSSSFVSYGHAATIQPPHRGTTAFEYQSRPAQEQNQDEIWRNFMLGFGPIA
ncbi:hypothetical protein D9615_003679 [Tricholomella constricta]|uniref:Xylanolytic transcriptional activator regulatory domain-containing protein n=1 Tax=Tricholomella constricta TaxID=117010 RepID=A0A8H5HI80_9AGAR|nr:hypothetical protein D9615_003679 [Tricholomella constricta]